MIVEIFVWIIEIVLVLVAIFFHWVEQRSTTPAITREGEGEGNGEKVNVGSGAGSGDAVQYRLHDLEIATDFFSDDNMLGKGGCGVVYKGLLDGQTVAIKKLNGSSVEKDFANEVSLLSSLRHNNLIKLLGFCCEAGHFILVVEYAPNGDLYHYLNDESKRQTLSWEMRFEIIKGFARGLSYLHHGSQNSIIHRDIKPANVLLDEHHCTKIADFGLSRTFDISNTHKTTKQLAGTIGYIAPELFFKRHFSTRSDVYSYGVLVLETLAGCTVHQYAQATQEVLSHVVWKRWKNKKPLTEVIDSCLRDGCPQDQLMSCITIGLLCVQHDPKKRPDMKLVLDMLTNKSPLEAPSFPAFFEDHQDYHYSSTIQLQRTRPSISFTDNPGLQGNGTTNPGPGSPSFSPPPPYRPPSKSEKSKTKSTAIITFAWWNRRRPQDHSFHVSESKTKSIATIAFPWWRHRRPRDHSFREPGEDCPRWYYEFSFSFLLDLLFLWPARLFNAQVIYIPTEEDPEVLLGQLKRFSLRELQIATNNFDNKNVLGQGGFGKVYKGMLADGSLVAVKRLTKERNAGRNAGLDIQFAMERAMISRAMHRNLVRLHGFCTTPTERMLVYPYMANGSLASHLRERDVNVLPLDWPKRRRIALGAAQGLAHLHDHCSPRVIHRDVKAANILLDEDFEALFSDFGLAKFIDYRDSEVITAVRGTVGHLAPEYLSAGKVSVKTDVFGYGIMLLELTTGQRAFDLGRLANDDNLLLLDWVKKLLEEGRLEILVDPYIRNKSTKIEVESLIQIALLCTQASPLERPKMSEVIRMLEGEGFAKRRERRERLEQFETRLGFNKYIDSTCNLSAIELSGPR